MDRVSRIRVLLFLIITLPFFIYSCSTVRVIPEGSSLLKENNIIITNSEEIESGSLSQYLRQQPNRSLIYGWNPFLMIYNWSNGKSNGWDRFVKKIGQPPVILDSSLVKKSSENLKNHLSSLGYYNSLIQDTIITKRKKSAVNYKVTLGKSFNLREINYIIKDTAIERIVSETYNETVVVPGIRLSEKTLDLESERITNALRERGYYNFTKNFFFFEADTLAGDNQADLFIKIENYTRNESSNDSRKHELYRIRNITLFPDYDPLRSREDSLSKFSVLTMKNFTIYQRGERSIRPYVLEKMNILKPGELYNEKRASLNYNRFMSLRFYSGVNIQYDEVPYDSISRKREVDCIIRLTPSKSQGYKLNLEASSNSNNLLGISPAVSYYHKNLFKGGEWFTIGFMGNFQFKIKDPVRSTELGINTGISFPSFLLLPDSLFKSNVPRTDVNIGYNYQSRPEFTRNLISLNYGYNWRVGERLFYTVNPVQLNIVRLFNLSSKFYESLQDPFLKNSYKNHFDLGAGATIYYTTNPNTNSNRSFFYLRWTNDIAGNLISIFNSALSRDTSGYRKIWNTPYAQYLRSDLTIGQTWRLNVRESIATRFNIGVGYAYGNSRTMPYEKLFYAGGANSLRGWQARSVGPGSSAIDTTFAIPNQTGDLKLEVNAEYRFGMFWNIEGALFIDAGNIWTLRNEPGKEQATFRLKDFYKSVAVNWGFGARLNLDFVILRLDLGMVAHDPMSNKWLGAGDWFKKNSYSLQFGVGYPF
ncbi:MAG: BamA/TamA family outer membrane protein [Bacteroidales bacterium]